MRWETYNFTPDFQDAIFACLIRHPEEFFAFGEIVKPAYFSGPAASELMFRYIEYRKKYGEYPNFSTLGNFAFHKASVVNVDHAKETLDYVEKLSKIDTSQRKAIVDLSLRFAKERAVYDAIRKIHAAQTEGKMDGVDPVKIMQDAVAVGTNYNDLGISLYHDIPEFVRKSMSRREGVMPGYPAFEQLWPTGWGPGWLVVLLAPPKRYKCESPDTEILMYDGTTKKMKDMLPGDCVMGDDSTPRQILSCGRGHGPMYRVTQANGDSYTVTHDHILCVKRSNDSVPVGRFSDRYHLGQIMEITAEDYANKPTWFKRTWKGYKVGVNFPAADVPVDAYFLGLWLGDGSKSTPSISVGDSDPEIRQFLFEYVASVGLTVNEYRRKTHCTQLSLTSGLRRKNSLLNKLRALGVTDQKHVPFIYKKNSREVRLRLLAGLIDSDGNYTNNRGLIFVNTDEQLCKDTCWIARSLGFKSFVRRVKTRCTVNSKHVYSTAYRTYIQGPISKIPTKVTRKRGVDSAKATERTTIKVEPIGEQEWCGIEIDGNRRYLHGDFTVTHNTAFAINLALNIVKSQDADVLYYACEISQELAAMRALYNITGWKQEDFVDRTEKGIVVAELAVKKALWGNLWFKSYPSKSVTISEIKSHAHQVIDLYDLNPKAIVIDYAETVRPDKVDKDMPDWRQQADIYTQARALGAEFGCCVIMPDRCNRETVGKRVPSMKSFQGSFEKAGIVDAAIGLCSTDEEYKHDRVRYFVFLNRHGESYKHYEGSVDPERMRMTVGQEIDYTPEDEEDKPQRHSGLKRRMASGAALTQSDG